MFNICYNNGNESVLLRKRPISLAYRFNTTQLVLDVAYYKS